MAFTGIQTYSAILSSGIGITINEKTVEMNKNDRNITFTIREWFFLAELIPELDDKVKLFEIIFSKDYQKGVHTFERILSSSISVGVIMDHQEANVYLKYRCIKPSSPDDFQTIPITLNKKDFQALKLNLIDIVDFIDCLPFAHQANQIHDSDGEELFNCGLCYEVHKRGLDNFAMENRKKLLGYQANTNHRAHFIPALKYKEDLTNASKNNKKVLVVNIAQWNVTEL